MAKMPTVTATVNVEDLRVADVLAWLCRKADDENQAHAEGHRDHALYWIEGRAAALVKMIQQLRELRFDLDEEGGH